MLQIHCILHGSLEDSAPEGTTGNSVTLEFETQPSVDQILAKINLNREYLQFFLADGMYVELEDWDKPVQGERFQLWPRMTGG